MTAETLTLARLVVISAAEFRRVLATEPAVSAAAVRLMAAPCRDTAEQMGDPKLRGTEKRPTRFLRQRAANGSGDALTPAELPEPKSGVALRLGVTPDGLSRSLGALDRPGVIRQRHGGGLALLLDAPTPVRLGPAA